MKAVAITHSGLEDISSLEINELIGAKCEAGPGCVLFEVKNHEEIAHVCYKAQSVSKVLLLFEEFKINSIEDMQEKINSNIGDIRKIITPSKTFAVRSFIADNDDYEKEDICIEAADSLKLDSKVDLKNPDVVFFVYISKDNCYIGIDFSGEDLSKRDYRIYTHYEALKATRAYVLLRAAGFKNSDFVLDPFCGSGTILIEAAIFGSGFSQNYYTKDKFAFLKFLDINLEKFDKSKKFEGKLVGYDIDLRYIMGAKKNAKIAGVEKFIDFSKVAIEWIDIKLEEKSVDKIITNPPDMTHKNEKTVGKVYDELFKQAKFVLKEDGCVGIIIKSDDIIKDYAKSHGFKPSNEKDLIIGKDDYKIIVFIRS